MKALGAKIIGKPKLPFFVPLVWPGTKYANELVVDMAIGPKLGRQAYIYIFVRLLDVSLNVC